MPWTAEFLLFVSYCLGGVSPWVLYLLGMQTGLRRLDLVNRAPLYHAPVVPGQTNLLPRVLAIVPARNEHVHIEGCVSSLLAQTSVDLRVLTINDGSTDNTPALLDRLASRDSRLTVLHLPASDVPPGWTGKCRAIVRGLQEYGDTSSFDYLLFIDSDTAFEPPALEQALRLARMGRDGDDSRGHGLVSLLPRQHTGSSAEKALVPLVAATVMGAFGVAYANNDHLKRHAFACGQFMLFRRDTYLAIGGHESVRGDLAEDVELARKVKAIGHRPRVALASDLGVVHQHAGLSPLVRQWARNLYGNRNGRPWTLLGPLTFLTFQALLLLAGLGWTVQRATHLTGGWLDYAQTTGWAMAVLTQFAAIAAMLVLTYRAQRMPWASALYALVGLPLLVWTLLTALSYCLTGRVAWRGRKVAHAAPDVTPPAATPTTPAYDSQPKVM